jgi:hypothetical protein
VVGEWLERNSHPAVGIPSARGIRKKVSNDRHQTKLLKLIKADLRNYEALIKIIQVKHGVNIIENPFFKCPRVTVKRQNYFFITLFKKWSGQA